MRLNESELPTGTKVPISEDEGSFVLTPSTHLAAFLGTCGCQPVTIKRGPEKTGLGTPVVKWVYTGTPKSEQIMLMWRKPNKEARDWDALNDEEKEIVINFLTAFSENLRHFLAEAKKDLP